MSKNINLTTSIKNPSFEAPALDDGAFTLIPTSWNIFDPFGFVPDNPTSTSSRVSAYLLEAPSAPSAFIVFKKIVF